MIFNTLLEKYRKISFSERDKGDRFERLIQGYLQTEPLYTSKFKNVWMWNDFPSKNDFENGLYVEPRVGFVQAGTNSSGLMFSNKLGYVIKKFDFGIFADIATSGSENNLMQKSIFNLGLSLGYSFKLSKN